MVGFDWSEWAILRFVGASFILWMCYYLLFDRKAPFNKCRIYLLCSVLLAGAIATIRIPVYPVEIPLATEVSQPIITQDTKPSSAPAITTGEIEEAGISPEILPTETPEETEEFTPPLQRQSALQEEPFYASWNYWQLAWYVYGLGILVLLAHLSIEMIRIWRLKRWGSCTVDTDGICIVRNNNVISPFSFYRTVFINRKIEGEVLRVVLLHEKTHIGNHHYRDTFFIEILCILCWFNPFVWLIKRELRALHEFQVDRNILTDKIELFNYQSILFEELMGYSPNIANGFHNSLIKKRFIMMKHQYKERAAWLRKSALFLIIAGMTALFSFTEKPVYTEPEYSAPVGKQEAIVIQAPTKAPEQENVATEEPAEIPKIKVAIRTEKLKVQTTIPSLKLKETLPEKKEEKAIATNNTNEADFRPDQVVVSRAHNTGKTYIRFVECTKNETRVTIAMPVFFDAHWVQFSKGYSIVDKASKDIYRIRSVTRNIEINKTYWIIGKKDQLVEFTLVFPPLNKKVKTISIRDCFPEERGITPSDGGIWTVEDTKIDELAPTQIRLAEYDKEGRPLRADQPEEVTLRPDQVAISPVNGRQTQIDKIITTENNTLVTLRIPIYWDRHWIKVEKGLCIVDHKSGTVYPIQGVTRGIEMNKLLWVEGCKGRSILITLIFPRLKDKVKIIDLYNKYPDANTTSPLFGSEWNWRNIMIANYQHDIHKNIYL